MNDIKEPNLQKRANNIGIIYVQDVQQGTKIPNIDIGGVVTVKYEGVTVIVKIADKIKGNEFMGKIIGFESIPI
jgi:arginine decarboxylase-like protein